MEIQGPKDSQGVKVRQALAATRVLVECKGSVVHVVHKAKLAYLANKELLGLEVSLDLVDVLDMQAKQEKLDRVGRLAPRVRKARKVGPVS